jgi:ATP-dependent RNA helicase DDX5/DBP2
VDDIRFVINYDFPTSDAVYIHRIGRTGRNSQNGTAFTFFSNEDAKQAPALIKILDEAKTTVHPTILQLGRKNGWTKWVNNVGSK